MTPLAYSEQKLPMISSDNHWSYSSFPWLNCNCCPHMCVFVNAFVHECLLFWDYKSSCNHFHGRTCHSGYLNLYSLLCLISFDSKHYVFFIRFLVRVVWCCWHIHSFLRSFLKLFKAFKTNSTNGADEHRALDGK